MDPFYIGIDIGGTKIAFGAFDASHHLLGKHRCPTDPSLSPEAFAARMAEEASRLMELNHLRPDCLAGIGIGAPGWVDYKTGCVLFTPNIPLLKNFPLAEALSRRFPVKIALENDAIAAALAEHTLGAGRGFSDMLYSTVSTGIGGGFILNGRVYHGSYGHAGEIGHILATPGAGGICGCGKQGCLETYASGAHIGHHVTVRLQKGEKTLMTEWVKPEQITGEILYRAFSAGDKMAEEIVDQMANYLGVLYYNIYQALNINCFVLGGGLTSAGTPLLDRIRSAFFALHATSPLPLEVHLRRAELTEDIGIIGAALLLGQ